jgi:hypothetical protein
VLSLTCGGLYLVHVCFCQSLLRLLDCEDEDSRQQTPFSTSESWLSTLICVDTVRQCKEDYSAWGVSPDHNPQ